MQVDLIASQHDHTERQCGEVITKQGYYVMRNSHILVRKQEIEGTRELYLTPSPSSRHLATGRAGHCNNMGTEGLKKGTKFYSLRPLLSAGVTGIRLRAKKQADRLSPRCMMCQGMPGAARRARRGTASSPSRANRPRKQPATCRTGRPVGHQPGKNQEIVVCPLLSSPIDAGAHFACFGHC